MARETRKKRMGRVVQNSMDKTVIVAVEWRQRHPLYKKSIRRVTRFFVHDGENRCSLGDVVRIEETRPISRLKRWRIMEIVEQHEVAEVKPIELDQAVLEEVSDIEAAAAPEAEVSEIEAAAAPEDDVAFEDVEDLEDTDALLFAQLELENQPGDDVLTLESEDDGTAVELEQDRGEGAEDEEKKQ